jgi:hypothetical protein
MEEKERCQSCAMPVSAEFANFGTDAAGEPVSEYCMFCYKEGAFTKPDMTVEEMIQSSVDFMTTNLGFPQEQAEQMSKTFIPTLGRWKGN